MAICRVIHPTEIKHYDTLLWFKPWKTKSKNEKRENRTQVFKSSGNFHHISPFWTIIPHLNANIKIIFDGWTGLKRVIFLSCVLFYFFENQKKREKGIIGFEVVNCVWNVNSTCKQSFVSCFNLEKSKIELFLQDVSFIEEEEEEKEVQTKENTKDNHSQDPQNQKPKSCFCSRGLQRKKEERNEKNEKTTNVNQEFLITDDLSFHPFQKQHLGEDGFTYLNRISYFFQTTQLSDPLKTRILSLTCDNLLETEGIGVFCPWKIFHRRKSQKKLGKKPPNSNSGFNMENVSLETIPFPDSWLNKIKSRQKLPMVSKKSKIFLIAPCPIVQQMFLKEFGEDNVFFLQNESNLLKQNKTLELKSKFSKKQITEKRNSEKNTSFLQSCLINSYVFASCFLRINLSNNVPFFKRVKKSLNSQNENDKQDLAVNLNLNFSFHKDEENVWFEVAFLGIRHCLQEVRRKRNLKENEKVLFYFLYHETAKQRPSLSQLR